MPQTERLRIDKYLWAIRIFKTRPLAAEACSKGEVKCKGVPVKSSKAASMGDRYEIKTQEKIWHIEITGLLQSRAPFSEAIKNYLDLTLKDEKKEIQNVAFLFNTGKRKSRKGRPTKKEKRNLDEFFG